MVYGVCAAMLDDAGAPRGGVEGEVCRRIGHVPFSFANEISTK